MKGKFSNYIFPEKKQDNLKNNCVPTLPKIFRPVTQNTLIFFYLALATNDTNFFFLFLDHSSQFDSGGDVCRFLFAAFEAANFQIEFFGNPVMRTAE